MATVKRQAGGIEADVRVDPPLKEFQFRLSRFGRGISDWRSCMRAFGELFKRQMGEVFETEGAAGGGRWKRLSEPYRTWKQAHYPGRKIGVLTNMLRSAMTGGGGYSEEITKTSGSFGMSANSLAKPYGKRFAELRPVVRLLAKHGRDYQKVAHQWVVAEERGSMGIGGAGLAGSVRAGGGGVGRISSALAEVMS